MKIVSKPYTHLTFVEFKKWREKLPEPIEVAFGDRIVGVEDICDIREDRMYLSGYRNGIVRWDTEQQQYLLAYYGSSHPLGAHVTAVVFDGDLTSELK